MELESNYDSQIHLLYENLVFDNLPEPLVISLQLKTDQLLKVVKLVVGRTHDDLCPVSALPFETWNYFWVVSSCGRVTVPCQRQTLWIMYVKTFFRLAYQSIYMPAISFGLSNNHCSFSWYRRHSTIQTLGL